MALFKSFLQAGFECGFLEGSQHDLLAGTRHTPYDRQSLHYNLVKMHGMITCRDGLPYRHDVYERVEKASSCGVEVIWDVCHYDPPIDPVGHAKHIAKAGRDSRLWVCPMNEPSICPMFTHLDRFAATELGIEMMNVIANEHDNVGFITTDPLTGAGEFEYEPTDRFVETGKIDVVGINYYPHTSHRPLSEVIFDTGRRYGLPVMIAETSWHNGHHEQMARYPFVRHKADWLSHVMDEVKIAQDAGITVEGVCWYPIVNCPAWGHPGTSEFWDHGLIGGDHLDEELSKFLKQLLK